MSLFKSFQSQTNEGGLQYNAVAESAFTDNAICELTMELFHVAESSDIAGIVGAYAVQEGAHSATVLLENILTKSYEKMKAAFIKFRDKMKAYFIQIRKVLKSIFLKGKEFVKEFKAELQKKSTKGFKYTGFKYNVETGDKAADAMVESVETSINITLTEVMGNAADYKTLLEDEDAFKAALKKAVPTETKDSFADDTAKHLAKIGSLSGVDNLSDLKAELKTLYRGKTETPEEIEKFEATSVSEMCSFIEASDKNITTFEKTEKNFDRSVSKIISVIDRLEVTKEDNAPNAYKLMTRVSSKLTALLNSGKAPVEVKVDMYKEVAAKYESVLKSFLRYNMSGKPVNESTDYTGGMSLVQEMLNI